MTFLLLAATFSFASGPRASLAVALQEAAGAPVVLIGTGDEKVRAAKFDYASPTDVFREACRSFQFSSGEEGRFGFGPSAWPLTALGRRVGIRQAGQEIRVEERKWTAIPGERGSTTVGDVVHRMASPVPYHWFFSRVSVTVSAVEASEDDVMATLMAALDATKKPELGIQPNMSRFAVRLINGYVAMAGVMKEPDFHAAALLAAAFLRAVPKKEIEGLYATQDSSKSLTAPVGSVLYRAAVDFAKAAMTSGPTAAAMERQVQEVDPTHAAMVTFSNVGRISVRFTNRQDRPVLTIGREL